LAAEIVLEKHLKQNTKAAKVKPAKAKKGSRRKRDIRVIIAELIAVAVASYALCVVSWTRIVEDRCAATIIGYDNAQFADEAEKAYEVGLEQIKEVLDETVWTTKDTSYRKGPGTKYKEEGTLYEAASMTRTGVTYNEWSRVSINGEEYYILSEDLTTEEPLITATGAKGDYQRYALSQFGKYGWADEEIRPLIYLWNRESGWNPRSHNKKSGAHGIPQALPAGKMASEGSDYYTNGNTQIRWGLNYIYNRYGSPSAAWGHFQSHGWY
jgi:hypothetical protein